MAADATSSDPHGAHDWHSGDYVDDWIASDVTRDETRKPLLRQLAELLPWSPDEPIKVLDVGAGYGMLSHAVLERFPAATVTLQDFSEPMFEHARSRLAWAGDRLSFVPSDLRDPAWTAGLDTDFHAVVSSIAIHNVRDPDVIRRVFADVRQVLRPGGCFYDIDFVPPAGPLVARAGGLGRRLRAAGEEVPHLERQLQWLRDAGFDEVDCLLRIDGQTLLAGFLAP